MSDDTKFGFAAAAGAAAGTAARGDDGWGDLDHTPRAHVGAAAPFTGRMASLKSHWRRTSKALSQAGWIMLGENAGMTIGGRRVASDLDLLSEYLTNDVFYSVVDTTAMAVAQVRWRLFARRAGETEKKYSCAGLTTKSAGAITKSDQSGQAAAQRLGLRSHHGITAEKLAVSNDVVEVTDHPLLDLIGGSNEGLSATALRYIAAVYFEVFGGTYYHVRNGAFGIPSELKILPTYRIRAYRKTESDVVAYLYYPLVAQPVTQTIFPENEILSVRLPAVNDPYAGRNPPGRAAFKALELCGKYTRYEDALLENRARPDGVFIPDKDAPMDKIKAKRAEAMFNDKFRGRGAGRILVAENSGVFVPTSFRPKDIGDLKINQEMLRRVANAFGVPEALLSKDSTYANLQGAQRQHAENTVLPRVLMTEERWNEQLVQLFGDDLFLAAENPVPRDEAMDVQRAQIAITAGILTRNEQRAALGYDKVVDGQADLLPWNAEAAADQTTEGQRGGDTPTPADPDKPVKTPAAAAGPSAQKDTENAQSAGRDAAGSGAAAKSFFVLRINEMVTKGELDRATGVNLVARELEETQEAARRLVGHAAEKVADAVTKEATPTVAGMPAVPAGYAAPSGTVRQNDEARQKLQEFFAGQQNEWGALGDWLPDQAGLNHDDQALAAMLLLLWEHEIKAEAATFGRRLGITQSAEKAATARAMGQAKAEAAKYARLINQTTYRRVQAAVAAVRQTAEEAQHDSNSPEAKAEARKAANEVFEDASNKRSETIMLDQGYRGKMLAQIALAAASDVLEKIWITAEDEKVCPFCGQLDGQHAEIGGKFENTLGAFESPPAHVNCRCWLMYTTGDGRVVSGEDLGLKSAGDSVITKMEMPPEL